jgi:hypothetical protein
MPGAGLGNKGERNDMFGLNAVALMVFAGVNMLAMRLCVRGRQTAMKAIRWLCFVLLAINVCRYALSPFVGRGVRIPVEYSTVAYFAVPLILISRRKLLQSWAAYSGMIAGFFYYLTMVAAGGPIYETYPPYEIYLSMFCHATLYLCGLVIISTQECDSSDGYKLIVGTACVAANALLFRPLTEGTERIFIYELLDGVYIRQLFSAHLWPIVLPGYYIAMIGFVLVSVRWFFKLNQIQYSKYALPQGERAEPIPAQ